MTTTVESTTEATTASHSLPATDSAWLPLVQGFLGEQGWDHVDAGEVARILAEAAQGVTDLGAITPDMVRSSIVTRIIHETRYNDVGRDNQRWVDWIMEQVEGAIEDDQEEEPTEAPASDRDHVVRAFKDLTPSFEAHVKDTRPARWEQIIEVATYQYDKWKRGRNLVASETKAVQQFARRMNREYSWSTSGWGMERYVRNIGHVLNILRREAAGEIMEWVPLPPTEHEVRARIEEDDLNINGDRYYLTHVSTSLGSRWRRDGDIPDAEEGVAQISTMLRDYLRPPEVEKAEGSGVLAAAYGIISEMYFGKTLLTSAADGVVDEETLISWQIDAHPDAGGLQRIAIENGVRTWIDEVRLNPEKVEEEGLVEALRRWVKAYGFTKYTGKVMKRTLTQTLLVVFATHKGEGLTAERWPEYHERFRTAVAHVAGRYGEAHGFCSQLEAACNELTVNTKKPTTKVRFKGSGVTIEVDVPAWWDAEDRLSEAAREAWSALDEEGKEAAIVSRDGVYVNWSDMTITR